jgi:UDPglucose 6-dehydrogenase/GDP-mannose 6-dehydrogenase
MRLTVIGAGYVGLVTGACLADAGHEVILVDLDDSKVADINAGDPPIFEPGLEDLLDKHVNRGLKASSDMTSAVAEAEVVMLAVGTPSNDQGIDLTHLEKAARQVGEALAGRDDRPVVVVKSTVVPGTTSGRVGPILVEASGLELGSTIGLGVNPEFLTEGTAVHDFTDPDRIVIGADDEATAAVMLELYAGYDVPKMLCGTATAEMIKYASNTLLATLISFSNEIASLSARIDGVDVAEVMAGVHASRYLSAGDHPAEIASFIFPGVGYGGSCLPKDTVALAAHGRALGVPMPLLEQVDRVNRDQPIEVMRILSSELGGAIKGRAIGVLGVAFKPDTDDVRESPAFPIIELLLGAGAEVTAHDPMAIPNARKWLGERPGLDFEDDLSKVVAKASALILVTSWDEYRQLPELIVAASEPPLLVDGRRFLPKSSVPYYSGIGL